MVRVTNPLAIGALLLGVGAVGCSAILGIHEVGQPSDGGVDVGSDVDRTLMDGAGEPQPDATSDASPETSAFEAGDASMDASDATKDVVDASADTIADASTTDSSDGSVNEPDLPCAQQGTYVFCDDFDSVTSVAQSWTGSVVALEGGTWTLDMSDHVSSPASAQAAGPVLSPSGVGQLDDYLNVPPLTSWIRLAFDVRVDLPSYVGSPMLGVAHLYVDASMSILYEILQNGTAEIVAFTSGGANTLPVTAPPLRTWVRIVLQYDRSTGMTAWQSGSVIASDGTITGTTPASPVVYLGATGVQGSSSEPFALEFDNVVVRGQ